jgi:pyruvate formate-lyase/glycerol dehydratase family glycyl radical enzyme
MREVPMLQTVSGSAKTALSARVEKLKSQIFASPPKVCIERALAVTRSYRETEGLPEAMRRAEGLARALREMTVLILEDELIVGNQISAARGVPVFPEMACRWLEAEIGSIGTRPEKFRLGDEDARTIAEEILPYWRGHSVQDRIFRLLPEDLTRDLEAGVFNVGLHLSKGIGHFLLDYALVLGRGLEDLVREVRSRIAALDLAERPEDVDRRSFYLAVQMVLEAVLSFAERYASMAEEQARCAPGAQRRAELEEIARICRRVPWLPARTFREALQSFWFVQLVPHIDSDGTAISPGRFDQYLGPYLDADLREGRLTLETAQDLVDQLWLKFNQILSLWKADDAKYFGGFPISQNLIVGGVDRNGVDATNALSLLALRATERLRLPQPALSARLHLDSPEEFLQAVIDVIATGVGMPALFNDGMLTPCLMARGMPLEDARDYAIIGCVEPGWHGRASCASNAAYFNLLKCLELALGNGVCAVTGRAVGPKTGDPAGFASIGDVMGAFERQVAWWVRRTVAVFNVIERVHQSYVPFPFNSALVADCLERGKDYLAGGARYNLNGMQGVGIANVADAMAGIEQVVFRERRLTLPQLIEALRNDFGSDADLHEHLRLRVPHYGNDDEQVDRYAREAGQIYCREVERYTSPRGARYHPGLYPVSANIPLGRDVGASADGRLARSPLADGVAPRHGADTLGPTAVLRSAARLDQALASNGTQLNQKFLPAVFRSPRDRAKFASYLRAFVGLPIQEVQFNVVDRRTLQDAQAHPERHPNLVVRVAGYSAFFNDLDRSTQDDIVGRTEQTL